MSIINSTIDDPSCAPVLLLYGGSQAVRERLIDNLRATCVSFQIVELATDLSPADLSAEGDDVSTFIQEFGLRIKSLTKKERVVLQSVLDGQTNKSISLMLDLTERAIELRKASLMRKLNTTSHTDLVCRITKYQTLQRYFIHQATDGITPAHSDRNQSLVTQQFGNPQEHPRLPDANTANPESPSHST